MCIAFDILWTGAELRGGQWGGVIWQKALHFRNTASQVTFVLINVQYQWCTHHTGVSIQGKIHTEAIRPAALQRQVGWGKVPSGSFVAGGRE